MKIDDLRLQKLEERQLKIGGLAIAVLGAITTFVGIYATRSREVGYSQTNYEINAAVSYELKQFEKSSNSLRFQF